jgi:hypothetical protein
MSEEVTSSLCRLAPLLLVPTVQDWNDKLQAGRPQFVADMCFSGAFAKLRKATVCLTMSVCAPTGRILMKFYI